MLELNTVAPGKGQALVAGFRHLGDGPDLVGVFDADSHVDPDFLSRVASGWVGSGYGLERQARNLFWWRPREALGLGTTINGTGYFIRPAIAAEILPGLRTLTEEPDGLGSAFDQRTRWARGHFGVLWYDWPKVVRRAAHGDIRAVDAAPHMAGHSMLWLPIGAWSLLTARRRRWSPVPRHSA